MCRDKQRLSAERPKSDRCTHGELYNIIQLFTILYSLYYHHLSWILFEFTRLVHGLYYGLITTICAVITILCLYACNVCISVTKNNKSTSQIEINQISMVYLSLRSTRISFRIILQICLPCDILAWQQMGPRGRLFFFIYTNINFYLFLPPTVVDRLRNVTYIYFIPIV